MASGILSIIVIVYKMPRQAMNTLFSLSAAYQKNIHPSQYEVIVVENDSGNNLDEMAVLALGKNFRYFLRQESSQSPVGAINFGFGKANGSTVCLMIDGARMVTPRIIEYALLAQKADINALVSVPGYNLGLQDQRFHRETRHDENSEMNMLAAIQWPHNGYRLFDISSIGGANKNGFFHPLMECNCVFTSSKNFERIGGANMDFQLPGGGSINLHIYRQLGMLPETRYHFILPGEGSFHQFHGGITTAQWDDLEEVLESHRNQLHSYWKGGFHALRREPLLLGAVGSHAQKMLHFSSQSGQKRLDRMLKHEKLPWADDKKIADMLLDY